MEIEYDTKVFMVDDDLQKNIEQMAKEGWHQNPMARSTATFHVMRSKAEPQDMGAFGTLHIDESKVQIMRNGKVVGN